MVEKRVHCPVVKSSLVKEEGRKRSVIKGSGPVPRQKGYIRAKSCFVGNNATVLSRSKKKCPVTTTFPKVRVSGNWKYSVIGLWSGKKRLFLPLSIRAAASKIAVRRFVLCDHNSSGSIKREFRSNCKCLRWMKSIPCILYELGVAKRKVSA